MGVYDHDFYTHINELVSKIFLNSCCCLVAKLCLTLMQPHELWPVRLLCPWGFPGKSTGVDCHFLLQCMKVKSESEVALSCQTLSDPMDCSLPGSSVHGVSQARVLEWGAIAFSIWKLRSKEFKRPALGHTDPEQWS